MPSYGSPGRRVAIVAGVRTPFAKSGTTLKNLSAIELGKHCVAELIQRTEIDGKLVELVVYGTVVPSVVAPNIAREVSLLPMLPKGVQAFTVSRACASANQAITDAADQIALGHADVVIAGGAESLSNVPILHSRGMSEALVAASRAKSLGGRVKALARRPPARPRADHARHRRAVHGRDDGRVGREDGEDQRHPARGAGSVRAALAPPRRRRHRRTGASPPRSRRCSSRRGSQAMTSDNGIRADTIDRAAPRAQAGVRSAHTAP